MADMKPMVVDVDGTFLRTDLLFESFWAALGRRPVATILTVFRNIGDRAALKGELAALAGLRLDLMPTSPAVQQLLEAAKAQGRDVVLASASDTSLVRGLAQAQGLTGPVLASNPGQNLKGQAKAMALVSAYGAKGFHYAGNAMVDMPIWEQSDEVIIVGSLPKARQQLELMGKSVTQLPGGWRWRDLIRALRPHQYVKNVLLLLPLFAAHEFGLNVLLPVILGIIAFSAAASCIYIVNDLLDLEADRLHASKHKRPFASGAVPISTGMITGLVLALFALGLAAVINWIFFGVLALYIVTSLAYSLKLKRMRWVDIATLASLYTIRVIAGAAASQVDVTGYMLVFVFPIFVTLGCVKRLTELSLATSDARLPGRGYGKPDRGDLLNVAGIGMFGALLIFFLYSFTEQAVMLYPTQWLLWVALVPIGAWLYRMVHLGYLGKQHHDPIVFAMTDIIGLSLIGVTLILLYTGAGLFQELSG